MKTQRQRSEYLKKWRAANKDKIESYKINNRDRNNKNRRVWAKENPEKERITRRKQNLRIRFGLTINQYQIMHDNQEGLCKICYEPETFIEGNSKRIKWLTVDHCHKTGTIRGLLCHRCNLGLGHFRDNIYLFINAIDYLES